MRRARARPAHRAGASGYSAGTATDTTNMIYRCGRRHAALCL